MTETSRNLLVGVFVIAALVCLGILMVMFGEAPSWLQGAEYQLNIRVSEISGIDSGTVINMNGIQIGRVETLKFIDMNAPEKGVIVVGKIKDRFRVPRGSRAECIEPPLGLGRGRIEIFAAGEGMPAVKPGGTIEGVSVNALENIVPKDMVTSLDSTVASIGEFARELTPVAQDLHELLKKTTIQEVDHPVTAAKRMTANLYTVVERFDRVLKNVDAVIGHPEVQSDLRKAIENVLAMTQDGRAALADFRDTSANLKIDASRIANKVELTVDDANKDFTELTKAAMPVLDNLAETTANLRVISQNLVEGKGTIGLLLTDNRLYEVLVLTVERARGMIDSLRRLFYRFEQSGRIGLNVDGLPVDRKIPQ